MKIIYKFGAVILSYFAIRTVIVIMTACSSLFGLIGVMLLDKFSSILPCYFCITQRKIAFVALCLSCLALIAYAIAHRNESRITKKIANLLNYLTTLTFGGMFVVSIIHILEEKKIIKPIEKCVTEVAVGSLEDLENSGWFGKPLIPCDVPQYLGIFSVAEMTFICLTGMIITLSVMWFAVYYFKDGSDLAKKIQEKLTYQ